MILAPNCHRCGRSIVGPATPGAAALNNGDGWVCAYCVTAPETAAFLRAVLTWAGEPVVWSGRP